MASRVARARARAPARVFLAHPRAVFLFVVACATLVPRLARAEREGWLLTTLTRASSGASSEDANGELTYPKSVAFTLDAFGTTYDANVRANPAFKPFGASLVMFTEFSRMETGKIGLG